MPRQYHFILEASCNGLIINEPETDHSVRNAKIIKQFTLRSSPTKQHSLGSVCQEIAIK